MVVILSCAVLIISLSCGTIATTIGRGIGVCYQLYHLARAKVYAYKMASLPCCLEYFQTLFRSVVLRVGIPAIPDRFCQLDVLANLMTHFTAMLLRKLWCSHPHP